MFINIAQIDFKIDQHQVQYVSDGAAQSLDGCKQMTSDSNIYVTSGDFFGSNVL